MLIYSSSEAEDSNDHNAPTTKLFGRERSVHSLLGGGQVANLLLWRNKSLSAAILLGITMIWFLFEVVEYNFVSLICHISILVMLIVFLTYTAAKFANWDLPDIHEITIQESVFRWLYRKVNWVLLRFYEISSGENFIEFFLVIGSLWMISVLGSYFSSLNLLFFCFICLGTLPVLYEQYEQEVDRLIRKGSKDAKKVLKKFDSKVLNKIPRGRVKDKKRK
ncbi:reticulon-like protein B9 [Lactuca sativa]|uniref:reticulon-like protein B9 n=1 Tax=Lactuca sativa TaxID=4236 RepID=UPI000CAF0BF5|nr:reticulon-like protein B9 [Lactuca sativa]